MALANETLAAIRYGYGLRPGEPMPGDAAGLLAQVAEGPTRRARFPREGIAGRRETATRIISLRTAEAKAAREGKPNEDIRKQTQREMQRIYWQDAMARLAQAVHSPLGFYERLASFWTDHFSTSALKSLPMRMVVPLYEAEAIRPNIGGSFSRLLTASILHPAMLIYLDQDQNTGVDPATAQKAGRGLNENLGRALLEFHTLGAGSSYTQSDVRAAALILTGLSVDNRALQVVYRPRFAEGGAITLLGRDYDGDEGEGQDHVLMLEDLAAKPKTAEHICRKLVAHFIADDPPEDLVAPMVAAWARSQGNLTEVYRAMLTHPRAWAEPGQKIKQPFEFVASGFRSLGLPESNFATLLRDMDTVDVEEGPVDKAMKMAGDVAGQMTGQSAGPMGLPTDDEVKRRSGRASSLTLGALQRMGQPIWQPPSPAGFPDKADLWLSPDQLTERISWSRMVAKSFGQKMEPSQFLEAALADAAGPDTRQIISQAPNRLHGITMVLASPEFNRR
ncbi:DUF1800 domain-containing protein [Neorhizobium lilium]|uniref:DUF1800 domain-containing protein n=1 Tax=Neorhizobium lilium TaxID=2503024 RepID=A0A3S4UK21_9HYPH|nr:DUF1800 domain-containing protein [Neorhizobium lilium]RWX75558.1 DUF1800 domain-containing protein [Neorhizobium lilium]